MNYMMNSKTNGPLISVIVPCYKVERYLPKCVDSILRQTYQNLEIWLIDDGSPDNCGRICDEYATKDSRIKVIHKENGGLSDARNVAIDIVEGDFLMFVDSDDWLRYDAIELMVYSAISNDADIVVSNFAFVKEHDIKWHDAFKIKRNHIVYTPKEALLDLFYQQNMETGAWGKLYKRDLWKDIRFPVGRLFEDIPTIYKTFFLSKKIVVLSTVLYYYLLRDTSIMGSAFNPRKMDAVYCSRMMLEDVINRTDDVELINAARCRYVSMCFNTIFQTQSGSKEETYIWNEIIKNRNYVLKDFRARRKTIMALLFSFLGIGCLRKVYIRKH